MNIEKFNERISAEEAKAVKVEVTVRAEGFEGRFEGRAALIVVRADDGTYGAMTGAVNASVLADIDHAACRAVADSVRSTNCGRQFEIFRLLSLAEDALGDGGEDAAD